MIDNPKQVVELMEQMQTHLPISAFPTKDLARTLREGGTKIKSDRTLLIRRLFYLGDEGGIICDVTMSLESKEKTVVSLTHLRIPPHHPLAREIRAYQRERVRRLSEQGM